MKPFVVVCGMPRSGTRQFTDILNQHPKICVQGETRRQALGPITACARQLCRIHRTAGADDPARIYRSIALLFAAAGKGRPRLDARAEIHGFKTPNYELDHPKLTRFLSMAARPVVYLYCIRTFRETYLSYLSMGFPKTLDKFIRTYIESLRATKEIARQAARNPEEVRIGVLHLDDFLSTGNRGLWLSSRLFTPLGLTLSAKTAGAFLESTDNLNATARTGSRRRLTELPLAAERIINRQRRALQSAIGEFNSEFATRLTLD